MRCAWCAIPRRPSSRPNKPKRRATTCFGCAPLAAQCRRIVPEYQAQVIEAFSLRRGVERARNAVTDCLSCSSERADPGWHKAVASWEDLDRGAARWITDVERKADPDRWPV